MKPEDVPAELVEAIEPYVLDGDLHKARRALAAVLPEYGARVLEGAAESFTEGGMVRRRLEDLAWAARLAEGSQS